MIAMQTILAVADNTGAKRASMIGVLGVRGKRVAAIGDIIRVNVKESTPEATVKKGEVVKGVVVRAKFPLRRPDGTY